MVSFPDIRAIIETGATEILMEVDGVPITTVLDVSDRQREFLLAGGAINFVRRRLEEQEN